MNITLIAEPSSNPVLDTALDLLRERHTVAVLDPKSLSPWGFRPEPSGRRDGDMVLLKSRTAEARSWAHHAERAGAVVVNTPTATDTALDRQLSAELLETAGVPTPRTLAFASLAELAREAYRPGAAPLPWPLVIKSRTSRRGDLVRLVVGRHELAELLPEWGREPVIAQQFLPNDGFDLKFWVVGEHVSVARRPAALEVRRKDADVELDPASLPEGLVDIAHRAGHAIGLDLFGADIVISEGCPVVIDVNAFPGFRGASDAASHLAGFVEHAWQQRAVAS